MWAIVANTMPAAFWVLYFLLVHADARAAAMSELHTSGALASSADDAPRGVGGVGLAPSALEAMPALDSIIIETLRITSGDSSAFIIETLRITSGDSSAFIIET